MWLALALLFVSPLIAQNRKELENKRQSLIRDIRQTEGQLKETKKNKAATLDQYLALQSQIRKRQQLINTLHEEIDYANESINRSREVLHALSLDVERLKSEYARIVRAAYRHKLNNSFFLFLFSADSFNDAFRRWQYIRQFGRFRKKQARLILDTQETLSRKTLQLEERKKEKEALLSSQEQQKQLLKRELDDKNRILKVLDTSESRLAADLERQQKAHDALNNVIESVIREEMARRRQEARSGEEQPAGKALAVSEESAPLSGEFRKNRGRLPWPVREGVITRQFGKQQHPHVQNVQIVNNGIDIRTAQRAQVFSVFEGKVTGTQFIPGFKNTVIIQHGNYYTVYSNLDETFVERGDPIGRQQAIGKLGADKPEVHFEIWLEKKHLNPVEWVAKR